MENRDYCHDPRGASERKSLTQILARYRPNGNGCWIWYGSRNKSGYGQVNMQVGGRQTTFTAHRLQWMRLHGDPGELQVMHTCDNRSCINPDHLKLGTPADNMADCLIKGRHHSQTNPPAFRRRVRLPEEAIKAVSTRKQRTARNKDAFSRA